MERRRHVPLRMCIACRRLLPRERLFRLVRRKEDTKIRLDLERKSSGKGVYLCRSAECLESLRKQRRLRRAYLSRFEEGAYETLQRLLQSNPSTGAQSGTPARMG